MSRALSALIVLLPTLAACGDGSHDRTRGEARQMVGEAPPPVADAMDVDGIVTVALTEWSIELDRDTLEAGSVRFRVRNNGEEEHALAVWGAGLSERTERVPPGEWTVLDLDLEPGDYEVLCPLEAAVGLDHAGRGMRADLVVRRAPETERR